MATPYLGLNNSAPVGSKFSLTNLNANTQKIEAALYNKRADLADRVQLGSDWFTLPSSQKDWEVYTDNASGNKVVRHGIWAMVEIQFRTKRAIVLPNGGGNPTNTVLITLEKGYRPVNTLCLTGINSDLDAAIEFNPNGNCYISSYNYTSTTIPADTILRVGGRYLYVP